MFCYELEEHVKLVKTSEHGTVVGRAEYATAENGYLIRYAAADGRQVENWWGEAAVTKYQEN